MIACVLFLLVMGMCRDAAMSDIQMDKFVKERRGRHIGLWKVTWYDAKGEILNRRKGQYINDMLDIVRVITTSEEYSTDDHHITVEFD